MDKETTIIDTMELTLWDEKYEITKAEININNKHRAERVFIKKM